MKSNHAYPIQILRDAVARLTREAEEHESRAMRAGAAKEACLNNIKVAEAAIDHLLKSGPGVEYSPADGEGAKRKHTLAVGDRVATKNDGGYMSGRVGTIEKLQLPVGTHPRSVPWYEVRFPKGGDETRGPLLTMSEGTLEKVHEEESEEERLTFERGWRLKVKGFGPLEDGTEVEVMDVAAVGRDLYRVKTLGVSASQWNISVKNLCFHSEGLKASTGASRPVPGTRVRVSHPSVPEGTTANVIAGGTKDLVKVRLHGRDQNVYDFAPRDLTPLLDDNLTVLKAGYGYAFHREDDRWNGKMVRAEVVRDGEVIISCNEFPGERRSAKPEELR